MYVGATQEMGFGKDEAYYYIDEFGSPTATKVTYTSTQGGKLMVPNPLPTDQLAPLFNGDDNWVALSGGTFAQNLTIFDKNLTILLRRDWFFDKKLFKNQCLRAKIVKFWFKIVKFKPKIIKFWSEI